MIESKNLQIGDDKFVIQSLPATRALSIAARLAKIMGGAGLGITDITLKREEIPEVMHVGNMVQGILQKIDVDDTPLLIRTIVRESITQPQFEGTDAEEKFDAWYEVRFSRGLQDLALLLYEIFAHNYGDPIEFVKKILARAIENGWLTPSVPSKEETNLESAHAG